MRTKILIIANPEIFTKEYIENVLSSNGFKIYQTCNDDINNYKYFYKKSKIILVNYTKEWNIPFFNKIDRINDVFYRIRRKMIKRKYDVIHVHGIYPSSINLLKELTVDWESSYIVGTFWGSDLLRATDTVKKEISNNINIFKKISISTDAMEIRFKAEYGNIYKHTLQRAHWGIGHLSFIMNEFKNNTRNDCKMYFGFSDNDIVISIGYSGDKGHQHLKVIDQIKYLSEYTKKKIIFILPMTYGYDDNYTKSIKRELNKLSIKYKIFIDYMSEKEIAKLRIATDVYINSAITDAASATIVECLYAGAILINPVWIKYSLLENIGVKYKKYYDFNEIPEIIENIIESGFKTQEDEREKIETLFLWENAKESWLKLYN